jgi:hypothetical protein
VDVDYFKRELSALKKSLDDRPADELERYLLRLADVAKPANKPLNAVERNDSGGVASKCGTANKSSLTCLCKEGDLHYRKVVDGVIVEASLSYEVNKECPIHGHYMR